MNNTFKTVLVEAGAPARFLQDYQPSSTGSEEKCSVSSNSEHGEHADTDYCIELDFEQSDESGNEDSIETVKHEGYEKFKDTTTDFGPAVTGYRNAELLPPPYDRVHGNDNSDNFIGDRTYCDLHHNGLEFEDPKKKSQSIYSQNMELVAIKSDRLGQESVWSGGQRTGHGPVHTYSEQLAGNYISCNTFIDSNSVHNSEMKTSLPQSNFCRSMTNKTTDSSTKTNKSIHETHAGREKQDSGNIPADTSNDTHSPNNPGGHFTFDVFEPGEMSAVWNFKSMELKSDANFVERGEKRWENERSFTEIRVANSFRMAKVNSDNSQRTSGDEYTAPVVFRPMRGIPDFSCKRNDESEVIITSLGASLEQAGVVGLSVDGVKREVIQNHVTTNRHRLETTQHYTIKVNLNNEVAIKGDPTPRNVPREENIKYSHKKASMNQKLQMVDEMNIERQNKSGTQIRSAKKLVNRKQSEKNMLVDSYSDGNTVRGRKTKAHSSDSNPKRLQSEVHKLPKPLPLQINAWMGFPYVLNMRAINRLQFGPYSKNVNQIWPARAGRRHRHLRKATAIKNRGTSSRTSKIGYNVIRGSPGNKRTEHGSDRDLLLKKFTPGNKTNIFNYDDELMVSNKQVHTEIKDGKENAKPVTCRESTTDQVCNQIEEADQMTETRVVISAIDDLPETKPACQEFSDVTLEDITSDEGEITMHHQENEISSLYNDDKCNQRVIANFGSQTEIKLKRRHNRSSFENKVKASEEDSNEYRFEENKVSTISKEFSKNKENLSNKLLLKEEMQATKQMPPCLEQHNSDSAKKARFRDLLENTSIIKNSQEPPNSERKPQIPLQGLSKFSTVILSENRQTCLTKEASFEDNQHSGQSVNNFTSSPKASTTAPLLQSASDYKLTSANRYNLKSVLLDEWPTFVPQDPSLHLVSPEDGPSSLNSPQHQHQNSPRPSLDSTSKKSVDLKIKNATKVVLPRMDEEPKAASGSDEPLIKTAIPFLPLAMAVCCLILNVFVPGSGTVMSGLLVLCCGQPRLMRKEDQILTTMCVNCMVGLAQLFTVSFFLVGWFWSVAWGVRLVLLSVQHRRETREQTAREHEVSADANRRKKQPITLAT